MTPVLLSVDRDGVAVWIPVRVLWAAKDPRGASEALTAAARALARPEAP